MRGVKWGGGSEVRGSDQPGFARASYKRRPFNATIELFRSATRLKIRHDLRVVRACSRSLNAEGFAGKPRGQKNFIWISSVVTKRLGEPPEHDGLLSDILNEILPLSTQICSRVPPPSPAYADSVNESRTAIKNTEASFLRISAQ